MPNPDQLLNLMLIGEDIETRVLFKNAFLQLGKPCNVGYYYTLNKAVEETHSQTKTDIIFLDTNSSADACRNEVRQIRDYEPFKNCPLVVYDSGSRLRDTSAIFSEGADVFINKPYDFQRLRKVIGNLVNSNLDFNRYGANRMTYFL